MQLATRKPVLTLGLVFCAIGILWSVNVGGPDLVLHQQSQHIASKTQLLPAQEQIIWYSPLLQQQVVQEYNMAQPQSSAFESYLIQGVMLLGVIVIILSTFFVGRRWIPSEQISEVHVSYPEVEAARILEMDHERACAAIAELSGAHRMEVLRSIVVMGDAPEDIPIVQVQAREQLELTSFS